MLINGKEMDLDIFDPDTAERFETAMKTVNDKMQELSGQETGLADGIRLQCEAVANCFDFIWGEGAAAYIFDGRINLKLALTAFSDLVYGVSEQKNEIAELAKKASDAQKPSSRVIRPWGK